MLRIRHNQALKSLNTLALTSSCAAYAEALSNDDVTEGLSQARQLGLPVVVLGGGSNIVFNEKIDALVLRQRSRGIRLLSEDAESALIRVAAGENWHELVQWSLQNSLFGLENLALIPGTVGAAPIQNIGAYGVELSAFVSAVHGLRIDDASAVELNSAACRFAYRDSVFKQELRDKLVITSVDLRLYREERVTADYPALAAELADRKVAVIQPQDVYAAVVAIRSSKLPDPATTPNAGSFFKNPVLPLEFADKLRRVHQQLPSYPQHDGRVKFPAAWFIDQCGWKGYQHNGLGVHPEHALVLVNRGNNSGRDLLALADEIALNVRARFGVELELEPRVYG